MIVSQIAALAVYLIIHAPRLPHFLVLHQRPFAWAFLPILGIVLIWKPKEMWDASKLDRHLKDGFRFSPWWMIAMGWFLLLVPLWLSPGEYF